MINIIGRKEGYLEVLSFEVKMPTVNITINMENKIIVIKRVFCMSQRIKCKINAINTLIYYSHRGTYSSDAKGPRASYTRP